VYVGQGRDVRGLRDRRVWALRVARGTEDTCSSRSPKVFPGREPGALVAAWCAGWRGRVQRPLRPAGCARPRPGPGVGPSRWGSPGEMRRMW